MSTGRKLGLMAVLVTGAGFVLAQSLQAGPGKQLSASKGCCGAAAAQKGAACGTGCGLLVKAEQCENADCPGHARAHASSARAQSSCPVMGGKIDKALYADVEGKRVYVCCRGCIATVKADPAKYLAVLAERGETAQSLPAATGAEKPAKAEHQPATVAANTLAVLIRARVPMTVLDARGAAGYGGAHIPGALNLRAGTAAPDVARVLPDKEGLIVTYCASVTCPASSMLAAHLRKLGYTNIIEYPEGIKGWTAAGLPTQTTGPAQ